MTTAHDSNYRREAKEELRIYQPRVGQHPNELHRAWVGKQVRVRWQQPVFSPAGKDSHGSPLWYIKWFGYVVELDKQIPSDELLPIPKKEPAT